MHSTIEDPVQNDRQNRLNVVTHPFRILAILFATVAILILCVHLLIHESNHKLPTSSRLRATISSTAERASPNAEEDSSTPPRRLHIIHIVADDMGRADLGFRNNYVTLTPHLNQLAADGIILDDFYAFKICAPSRASTLTGRYPWGIGWYNMRNEADRCLAANYTLLGALLKSEGYSTHAIGKWDVGYIFPECTAAQAGFDTFDGYYKACLGDYWYHFAAGIGVCERGQKYQKIDIKHPNTTDLSRNTVSQFSAWEGVNGTYSRNLFADTAVNIIANHDPSQPLYLYLNFQNPHLACGYTPSIKMGVQAPCDTIDLYPRLPTDMWKATAASMTQLDIGVGQVINALKEYDLWKDSAVLFHSDNGGDLANCRNAPFRGGKFTVWEGGVRVEAFINGGAIPSHRRGTVYNEIIHQSDLYPTFVEGIAGGRIPAYTGPRPVDGMNVWDAIMSGGKSPREEVIHQVNNSYHDENMQAIRRGNLKLIRGNPGDSRILYWPQNGDVDIPFGLSGGVREEGTDFCRVEPGKNLPGQMECLPPNYCLFDVVSDPTESVNLANDPKYADVLVDLNRRLDEAGRGAMPLDYLIDTKSEFWFQANAEICVAMQDSGFLEPLGIIVG